QHFYHPTPLYRIPFPYTRKRPPIGGLFRQAERAVLIMSTTLLQLLPALLRLTRDVRLKNTANAGPKPFYLQSNRRAAPLRLFSQRLAPTKTEPAPHAAG
ncbi:hypothetical protein, partial [Allofournierella massiliensis]|uniref:hypothetical protein n=1 Tax=Allofournierella massiliensis TaxID=1650663 RepID=UPI001A9B18F4